MQRDLAEIEAQVDGEYQELVPLGGREPIVLHLLQAHDVWFRAHDPSDEPNWVDSSKYPLMHAMRMASPRVGAPYNGIPRAPSEGMLSECINLLQHCIGYVGVWFAFNAVHRGICGIERCTDSELVLTPNDAWFAYDALDFLVHQEPERGRQAGEFVDAADEVCLRAVRRDPSRVRTPGMSVFAFTADELRALLKLAANWHGPGYVVPADWIIGGVGMAEHRAVWDAVCVLSFLHATALSRVDARTDAYTVLFARRSHIELRVSEVTGLSRDVVRRALDFLVLAPKERHGDVGITPFVPLGRDILAASPMIPFSSNFERNFCSVAARREKKEYSQASGELEGKLVGELAALCRVAGFAASAGTQVRTLLGSTDIDLMVFSPKERFLLTIEVKWIIQTADFIEVINRGEATCEDALSRQLPRHKAAIEADVQGLTKRAFGMTCDVAATGSGLVVRGYSGSPRLPFGEFGFSPEPLLRKWLSQKNCSLRDLWYRMQARDFVPKLGREFTVRERVITSPGGYRIVAADWEPLYPSGRGTSDSRRR
ncbi:MAG: hypothetical protein Q8P18_21060 [Pseudomonadota bacterium]|nr:hypothetical protein [Pseudomonadota bacterium]